MDTELKEAVDYLKGQAQIGKALDDAWRLMENDTIRKLGFENAHLRSAIDEVIQQRDALKVENRRLWDLLAGNRGRGDGPA